MEDVILLQKKIIVIFGIMSMFWEEREVEEKKKKKNYVRGDSCEAKDDWFPQEKHVFVRARACLWCV